MSIRRDRCSTINDSGGKSLTKANEVQKRWKEYIEILYDKENKLKNEDFGKKDEDTIKEDEKEPELLNSEIRTAIKEMKTKKSEGADGIPAEFWKAEKELIVLCKDNYERGICPGQQTSQRLS